MNREDAIKIVKSHYPANKQILNEALGILIPELKEDEDELTWLKNYISEEAYSLSMDIRNKEDSIRVEKLQRSLAWLEKQGERKPTDKIQIGKEYKCIASPRYSTFMTGKIYKPEDKFLCSFMNFCSDCFEPIEDSEQIDITSNTDKVESKFKVGDWVVTSYGEVSQVISVDKDYEGYTLDNGNYFSGTWCDMYHLWTIDDAKDGDIIYAESKFVTFDFIYIFSEIKNENSWTYCSVDSDCDDWRGESRHWCFDNCKGSIELDSYNFYPATKEQRDILFAKMKEEGYGWDSEKKQVITLNHFEDNDDMVEPKFKVGDIIHCKHDNRTFVIKEVDLKKGVYIYTEKGCGNDINYADEMFELVEPNAYSGTSFVYNNHTWGMCARDGGVDILCDSKLIKHINEQKTDERKEFVLVSFGTDIKLENDTIIIPDGYVATIDGNKIYIKKEGKSAFEAIKEEIVNKPNKVEPKFKVGDWITDGHLHCKISEVLDDRYIVDTKFAKRSAITFEREHNYHLWTIEDAKEGDVLYHENKYGDKYIVMNKGLNERGNINSYFRYNSLDGFGVDIPAVLSTRLYGITPATKEQRDFLFQKMKEAGYEWDAEHKKLTAI